MVWKRTSHLITVVPQYVSCVILKRVTKKDQSVLSTPFIVFSTVTELRPESLKAPGSIKLWGFEQVLSWANLAFYLDFIIISRGHSIKTTVSLHWRAANRTGCHTKPMRSLSTRSTAFAIVRPTSVSSGSVGTANPRWSFTILRVSQSTSTGCFIF